MARRHAPRPASVQAKTFTVRNGDGPTWPFEILDPQDRVVDFAMTEAAARSQAEYLASPDYCPVCDQNCTCRPSSPGCQHLGCESDRAPIIPGCRGALRAARIGGPVSQSV